MLNLFKLLFDLFLLVLYASITVTVKLVKTILRKKQNFKALLRLIAHKHDSNQITDISF